MSSRGCSDIRIKRTQAEHYQLSGACSAGTSLLMAPMSSCLNSPRPDTYCNLRTAYAWWLHAGAAQHRISDAAQTHSISTSISASKAAPGRVPGQGRQLALLQAQLLLQERLICCPSQVWVTLSFDGSAGQQLAAQVLQLLSLCRVGALLTVNMLGLPGPVDVASMSSRHWLRVGNAARVTPRSPSRLSTLPTMPRSGCAGSTCRAIAVSCTQANSDPGCTIRGQGLQAMHAYACAIRQIMQARMLPTAVDQRSVSCCVCCVAMPISYVILSFHIRLRAVAWRIKRYPLNL